MIDLILMIFIILFFFYLITTLIEVATGGIKEKYISNRKQFIKLFLIPFYYWYRVFILKLRSFDDET